MRNEEIAALKNLIGVGLLVLLMASMLRKHQDIPQTASAQQLQYVRHEYALRPSAKRRDVFERIRNFVRYVRTFVLHLKLLRAVRAWMALNAK